MNISSSYGEALHWRDVLHRERRFKGKTVPFIDHLIAVSSLVGEELLATIPRELAETLRRDATIDWQFKENVRAKLRLKIKTLLKRYKYPPDQQITAIDLVLQQAETLGEELAKAA